MTIKPVVSPSAPPVEVEPMTEDEIAKLENNTDYDSEYDSYECTVD